MARTRLGGLGWPLGGGGSMTRTTSIQGQLSKEELGFILDTLLMVCVLLKALEPILKRGISIAKKA